MPRKFRDLSDIEEAEIQRQIALDPDDTEATDEQLAQARPFADAFPALSAAIRKARGPARTKTAVSIRLDIDLVERLRASGPGWQRRVNDALREWIGKSAA